MKSAIHSTDLVKVINDRHIPRVDKFFRMCAGASSSLLELGKNTFQLEIKIDRRVTEESAPQLVWNIAQSWRNENPELGNCLACIVQLHRSPGPTGFLLPGKGDRTEIAASIREIKRASNLPAPLLARYLLGFEPMEAMVRAPDRTPDLVEN